MAYEILGVIPISMAGMADPEEAQEALPVCRATGDLASLARDIMVVIPLVEVAVLVELALNHGLVAMEVLVGPHQSVDQAYCTLQEVEVEMAVQEQVPTMAGAEMEEEAIVAQQMEEQAFQEL